MDSKHIIIVEPYAQARGGHIRNNLELWCAGLARLGFSPIIVSYAPIYYVPSGVCDYRVVPLLWRVLGNLIFIARYRNDWVSFFSYLYAFRLARRMGYQVIGLSTQTPLPVYYAANLTYPPKQWAQVVMYAGIKKGRGGPEIRQDILRAFKGLLSRGCALLVNSETSADILKKYFSPNLKIHHVFDLQYLLDAKPDVGKCLWDNKVLLIGGDDIRRSPLKHLSMARLATPIQELRVHFDSGNPDVIQKALNNPAFIDKITITNEYLSPDEFTGLFSKHKFSLIAYDTNFFAASSILLLSVATGTPVLTSNFAFAKEITCRYGKIGEMFEYGNILDFQDKWEKLASWGQDQWQEFALASSKLAADCGYQQGLPKFLEYTGIGL